MDRWTMVAKSLGRGTGHGVGWTSTAILGGTSRAVECGASDMVGISRKVRSILEYKLRWDLEKCSVRQQIGRKYGNPVSVFPFID